MRALDLALKGVLLVLIGLILPAGSSFAASLNVAMKEGGGGSYLVDDKGMALFQNTKDMPNKSVCGVANGCIESWQVFFADTPEDNKGIDAAAVGTITGDDGYKQTTYKGKPLYYFFKDKPPKDAIDEGINGEMFVVAP